MLYPELDTPCVIIDLDIAERNVQRMQAIARQAGVKLRPHTKTHKSSYFARLQAEAGAQGITVAKLGEAEVLANAGFDDILIAYPIVGQQKLDRLKALLPGVRRLIVSLDGYEVAEGLSAVGLEAGRSIEVYAEVDTGQHRVGRAPGADAIAFCRGLERYPGIQLAGIMSHAGLTWKAPSAAEVGAIAGEELRILAEVKQALGRPDLEISVGATPSAHLVGRTPGITEMRPGTYIFGDRNLMLLGMAAEGDCAMRVLTTIVSHAVPERAVVDAGSKSLAMDAGPAGGHGHVVGLPGIKVARLTEEHGALELPAGLGLKVGGRLEIIPNHVCPAVNLVDRVYGVRSGKVQREIPIEGRGKNT